MKISNITRVLETIAPPPLAESWDNTGLLVGDSEAACTKMRLCIDLTEAVLNEAIRDKAQLVMAYHPVIFKPVARVTPTATPIVYKALQAHLAVYSMHTAYDSAIGGANDVLADALGMSADRKPLQPRNEAGPYKVVVYAPPADLGKIQAAAFAAGAGMIDPASEYTECGFSAEGVGTFHGSAASNPAVGQKGRREAVAEVRWETVCPRRRLPAVLAAVTAAHRYEEPAIDVFEMVDAPVGVGLGRVGRLASPTPLKAMLDRVKKACGVSDLLLAGPTRRTVRTLAVGCGSCGGMFREAVAAGADLYVTGELRHHDALAAAAGGLTVACVGHSNSERLTLKALARQLRRQFPALDVRLAKADRDPFKVL